MANKLTILILLIISASCSTAYHCKKCLTQDSTITVIKDSLIYITTITPKDSASITVKLDCDSLGNVYMTKIDSILGIKSKVRIVVKNNYLTSECICDSASIRSTVNCKNIVKTHYTTKTIFKTKGYDYFFRYWFAVSLLILMIVGYVKFR